MKTIAIILIAICFTLMGMAAMAQRPKTDTAKKEKPVYEYFVKVPVDEYQKMVGSLHDYKDQMIYNPLMSDKEVRANQANINAYLFTLPKLVKLDSVLVKNKTISNK